MSDPKQSRGFRNRNPGNIDFVPANRWQGQIGLGDRWMPAPHRRFAEFESHEYGIRALAALLTTYQDKHGLRTIRQIINRWAPPNENNVSSYVGFVDQRMPDRVADDVLDLHSYADMRPLVEAIITHENGGNPYDAATIDQGLALAGLPKPVSTLRDAAQTGSGRGAIQATVATGGAGVVAVIAQNAPAVAALQGLDWKVGVALIVAVGIGVVAYVLTQRKSKEP